ncbi:MAG TPA: hypothetical protein PLG60_08110 [Acidimicrobiales bacterium]|nr:hypothetical protein [Acidimicrobiales bacterium]
MRREVAVHENKRDVTSKVLQTRFWNVLIIAVGLIGSYATVRSWIIGGNSKVLGWYAAALLSFVLIFQQLTLYFRRRLDSEGRALRAQISNYLFLIPSDQSRTFYLNWVFLLQQQSRQAGRGVVFITPEFSQLSLGPETTQRRRSQALSVLEEMDLFGLSHFDGIFAIFANPDEPSSLREIDRYHKLFDSKLVLLDMDLNYSKIEERGFPLIDFVGSSEDEGGRLAAQLAFDYLFNFRNLSRARVLLLESYADIRNRDLWDTRRISSFVSRLTDPNSPLKCDVDIVSLGDCRYSRERTREILTMGGDAGVEPSEVSQFLLGFDLIFASNDDTALGACDVLNEFLQSEEFSIGESAHGLIRHTGPRVIGYNGSHAFFREVALNGSEWLIGTIDVRQDEQAQVALHHMEKLRSMTKSEKIWSGRSDSRLLNQSSSIFRRARFSRPIATEPPKSFQEIPGDASQTRSGIRRPGYVMPIVKIHPLLRDSLLLGTGKNANCVYYLISESDL